MSAEQPLKNMLLEPVEYKVDETMLGVWRRFLHPNGQLFAEYKTHANLAGLPFLHYTYGKSPETGTRIVAKGIIAIGRLAVGFVAIGQASFGLVAIGQLAIGLFFGFGQATTGLFALGQLAVGVLWGTGQISTGYVAIGQIGLGKYVLAQYGIGQEVWDMRGVSPAAQKLFKSLVP